MVDVGNLCFPLYQIITIPPDGVTISGRCSRVKNNLPCMEKMSIDDQGSEEGGKKKKRRLEI